MAQDSLQNLVTLGNDDTTYVVIHILSVILTRTVVAYNGPHQTLPVERTAAAHKETRRTLPVELWLKVISEVASREDLICLSKTCSSLQDATKDLVADWIAVIRTEEDADELATRIRDNSRLAHTIREVRVMPLAQDTLPGRGMVDIVVQLPERVTLRLSFDYTARQFDPLSTQLLSPLRCLGLPIFDFAPFYTLFKLDPHIEELHVLTSNWPLCSPMTLPSLRVLTCPEDMLADLTRRIRLNIWSRSCPSYVKCGALTHLHLTKISTLEDVLNVLGPQLVSLRVTERNLTEFLSREVFPLSLIVLRAPRLRYLEQEFFKRPIRNYSPWHLSYPPNLLIGVTRDDAMFPARQAGETLTLAWHLADNALGAAFDERLNMALDAGDHRRFRRRCEQRALSALRSGAPRVDCVLYGDTALTEKATLNKFSSYHRGNPSVLAKFKFCPLTGKTGTDFGKNRYFFEMDDDAAAPRNSSVSLPSKWHRIVSVIWPTRRPFKDPRRTLPVELWLNVISEIENREDLICLSRTCSSFRDATKDVIADWVAVIRTGEDADELATRICDNPRLAHTIREVRVMPRAQDTLPGRGMVDIVVQLPERVTLRLFFDSTARPSNPLSTQNLSRLGCLGLPMFDFAPFYTPSQLDPHIEELQVQDIRWSHSSTMTLPSLRILTCQVSVLSELAAGIRVDHWTPTPWHSCRALTHLHLRRPWHCTFYDVLNVLGPQLVSLRVVEPTLAEFLSEEVFPLSLILVHAPRLRYLEHEFYKRTVLEHQQSSLWELSCPPEFLLRATRGDATLPARQAGEPLTLAWYLADQALGTALDLRRFRRRCEERALSALRGEAPHVDCVLYGDTALTEKATLNRRGWGLVKERLTDVRRDRWRTV
ncbi:uncharacterized protein BXZ73DRAFT_99902 [Epithele typhae]|uniref:uncharacterized protein n=1 Tax=Epithele typhae TaxID=378194 RepID=UPI00200735AD|nr:uncharacterized protein BXZ73DRAFT_99902 [Epithele typhae]KAH9938844.1 hypothetical protein BXZ73DRAFT_99902 [Epithele typhae]